MKIIKEGNQGSLYRGKCRNCNTEIECLRYELDYNMYSGKYILNYCLHCKSNEFIVFEEYSPSNIKTKNDTNIIPFYIKHSLITFLVTTLLVFFIIGIGIYYYKNDNVNSIHQQLIESK